MYNRLNIIFQLFSQFSHLFEQETNRHAYITHIACSLLDEVYAITFHVVHQRQSIQATVYQKPLL